MNCYSAHKPFELLKYADLSMICICLHIFTNLLFMRMESLKVLLTFGIILIVPVVLMPQFFIGLLILIVACLAFRQRNF